MPSWTPDHSMILSLLLDTVVGTKEMIEIRQDYCRIKDCIQSIFLQHNVYFTGSKSEGLNLPGSDKDYMIDINKKFMIKVTQSSDENNDTSPYSTFFMSTENAPPGFAILRLVYSAVMHPFVYQSSQYMNGVQYLSSDLFIEINVLLFRNIPGGNTVRRQGPSAELWSHFHDKSEPGVDHVSSIYCAFWPTQASEWVQRPRHFGWPTSQDVLSITDFGFHLVPVGHPHSDTKLLEWRISFSFAERILVWSFNHVQIQCYAVMKIILKEFIKARCTPENQILCSYFIKTFLFWKYESTEINFWRADNFRECINYVLSEFSKCLREGVLRHYFIPRFNLFSVKLTQAAQAELLQLFDIIIQSDISILQECRTLHGIWSEFSVQVSENRNNLICKLRRENLLRNDRCTGKNILSLINRCKLPFNVRDIISSCRILTHSCKTHLKTIVLRYCLFKMHRNVLMHICNQGNKDMYRLCRITQNDTYSFDISTCKLWCAILLYMKGFTLPALDIVNQVLSSIPPYAMYFSGINCASKEANRFYVEMFLDADVTMIQRARKAWMFDLDVTQETTNMVPFAFQIELYFSAPLSLFVSPFTCAYYLQFLCYHRMQQYDNRDRALQQLIEVAFNREQCGMQWTSLNIAGHCLLLAGRRAQARNMFYISYQTTQMYPPFDQMNSALWYLHNCFWILWAALFSWGTIITPYYIIWQKGGGFLGGA